MAHLEAGVGDVEHGAPAELALHPDRIVVAGRRPGVALKAEDSVAGRRRATIFDPFGNRVELIEA